MRPRTHSIALTLLGFMAGAAVIYALERLPSIKAAPGADLDPAVVSAESGQQAAPGFADAVAAAAPAVVKVYASSALDDASRNRRQLHTEILASSFASEPPGHTATRLGSGVIIASHGLIVTNGHVVRDREQIQVELSDGRILVAELLGIDDASDLAVLHAPITGLAPIMLGDPSRLRVGDVVLAIGNPFGIGQTVSLGIVSATGRSRLGLTEIEDFIQTDAAINPGNSGGALVDSAGRLVGISTAALSESGHAEGVGFAIPSTRVMEVVEAIADRGRVDRGWIGLNGRSVTNELEQRFGLRASSGVLVSSLVENGPAATAGIRAGDVITAFAGTEVSDSFQLRDLIMATPPEHEVPLVLWRGSERIDVTVRAGEWIARKPQQETEPRHQQDQDRRLGSQQQRPSDGESDPDLTPPCSARRGDC